MTPKMFGMGLMFYTRGAEQMQSTLLKLEGAFVKLKLKAKEAGAGLASAFTKAGTAATYLKTKITALEVRTTAFTLGLRKGLMGVLAGVATLMTTMYFPIKQARDFELYMEKLVFVAQRGTKNMESFRKEMMRFARQTAMLTEFSPTQVIKGLYEIASAGYSTSKQLEAIFPAVEAFTTMTAGALNLGQAGEALVAVLGKFNLQTSQSMKIVDELGATVKRTLFHMEKLPIFLRSLRAGPALMKSSLSEMLALGGVLRQIGLLPAQAGMVINATIRRISILQRYIRRIQAGAISSRGRRVGSPLWYVQQLGLSMDDLRDKATGEYFPLLEIMGRIIDKTKARFKTAAEQTEAYSGILKGMGVQLAVAIDRIHYADKVGIEAVRQLQRDIQAAHGVATRYTSQILDTLWGKIQLLTGSVELFGGMLGATASGPLTDIISGFTEWLNRIIHVVDQQPELGQLFVIFLAGVPILMIATGVLKMFYNGLGMIIGKYLILVPLQAAYWILTKLNTVATFLLSLRVASLARALTWLWEVLTGLVTTVGAFLFSPEGLIVLGIVALGAALVYVGHKLGWWGDLFGWILDQVKKLTSWISGKLLGAIGSLFGLSLDWDKMKKDFETDVPKEISNLELGKFNLSQLSIDDKTLAQLAHMREQWANEITGSLDENTAALKSNISTRDQYTLDLGKRLAIMRGIAGLDETTGLPIQSSPSPVQPAKIPLFQYKEGLDQSQKNPVLTIGSITFHIVVPKLETSKDIVGIFDDGISQLEDHIEEINRRSGLFDRR